MRLVPLKRAILYSLPEALREPVRELVSKPRPWDPGPRLAPPQLPDGMFAGPPDFVGVGAQKAGTSWWLRLIQQHPAVHRPAGVHKERHFFKNFYEEPFERHHVEEYHRWFPRPPGMMAGEWTPCYMAQYWTIPLIRQAAPAAKILVLLRDPVERYRSALMHFKRIDGRLREKHGVDAYFRGLYGQQLRWVRRIFPAENVLVLQYEQCTASSLDELQRTYRFLEVDPSFVPQSLQTRVNATRTEKAVLDERLRCELTSLYEQEVLALRDLVPHIDLALWPNFRHLAS